MRKSRWMKSILLTVFTFLLLSNYAVAEDTGYFGKISSWWGSVKEKITQVFAKKEESPAPANDSVSAPVPALPPVVTMPMQAENHSPSATTTLAPVKREPDRYSEIKAIEKVYFGKSFDLIHDRIEKLPVFSIQNDVRIPTASFPAPPQLKNKKTLVALSTVDENLEKLSLHEKYNPGKIPSPEDMTGIAKSNLKPLTPYPQKQLLEVPLNQRDVMTLLVSLIHWMADPILNTDQAANSIFEIAQNSKSNEAKQKSLAFIGWLLKENNFKSIAALYFSKSLFVAKEKEKLTKYNNAALTELGNISSETMASKTALQKLHNNPELNSDLSNDADGLLKLSQAEKALDSKNWAAARKLAVSVSSKSRWKEKARYLAAYALIASKDSPENYTKAGKELTELFQDTDDQEIFDISAVTLGRIHFILGNYKAAHQYLSQASKETNIFIEAAVDNSWALLRSGDQNHAVGNMFTLHTPNFSGAYMPESYFLQGLGYQEICQFGDALTSVKQFKGFYNGAFKQVADFNHGGKKPDSAYYEALVSFLSQKDSSMPPLVMRELGRHPEFLKRQKALNLFAKEQRALPEKFILSGKSIINAVQPQIAEIKTQYTAEMSSALKKRTLLIEEELKYLTANMALLEYEIFAGAGQNLALQGAQNFAVDEKNAVKKAEYDGGKEYWPYEDEIWEDELNNFRSKIVNNCAKVAKQ